MPPAPRRDPWETELRGSLFVLPGLPAAQKTQRGSRVCCPPPPATAHPNPLPCPGVRGGWCHGQPCPRPARSWAPPSPSPRSPSGFGGAPGGDSVGVSCPRPPPPRPQPKAQVVWQQGRPCSLRSRLCLPRGRGAVSKPPPPFPVLPGPELDPGLGASSPSPPASPGP